MASIAEPFASGDSFIHRTDPRMRLLSALAITLPSALLNSIDVALLSIACGITLVLLSKLNPAKVFKRLAIVNIFVLFLWIFIPFSQPGTTAVSLGPISASHEGIALALLISIKSNAIVLTLMALVGSIPVQNLGPAMQQLKISNKLCHILLFTYRYIFVIHQEYTTMRRAMQARGFKPSTNKHTYRSYAWLVGMLLVKSWDRAERVHEAMKCRGFHGRFYTLASHRTTTSDYIFLFLLAGYALMLALLEIAHRGLI